jgi:aminopeptidase N
VSSSSLTTISLPRGTPSRCGTIVDLWKSRPEPVAITLATGLYPLWEISQQDIDASEDFLRGNVPPPLQRVIREGQAEVIRALAACSVDLSQ